jgi:hypothetical protein
MSVSKGEIDRLGKRLRSYDEISLHDLQLLQSWRAEHQAVLDEVTKTLQDDLGLASTSSASSRRSAIERFTSL